VRGDQRTQVRGGSGIFTGRPAYVWISNQIGNTGMLTGVIDARGTAATIYPFNPNPDKYKPTTVTGTPAASLNLAVTDANFKFPQVWRTNIAVDRRLPLGLTGTAEFIYNRDVNGVYYINANLPAAQSAFVGADNRPRWTGPTCSATSGPCITRINNAPDSQVITAIVLKNQNVGRSWNVAGTLSKALQGGFSMGGSYSYGLSRNTVDPSTIATSSYNGNQMRGDPNNPGLGYSSASQGHNVTIHASFRRQYFNFGATSVSVFWSGHTNGNTSYMFASDMNGDSATNDLIYIPKDVSEMNFKLYSSGGITFTPDQQAQAWEAYIQQDKYLSKHRGEYAQRGAVFYPMVFRADLSLVQDVFATIRGKRHGFQVRLDIENITNMVNHNWGVGQRVIRNQILTSPTVDSLGRSTYNMVVVNGQLPTKTFETTTFSSDVYRFLISLRYRFN
jgi:hypothetical protein